MVAQFHPVPVAVHRSHTQRSGLDPDAAVLQEADESVRYRGGLLAPEGRPGTNGRAFRPANPTPGEGHIPGST